MSSYLLDESWPNWEMHPNGDEIVHCRSGSCELVVEADEGPRSFAMTPGATIVITKGTWRTVRVTQRAELLHITYGSGTTFKPASADSPVRDQPTDTPQYQDGPAPSRIVPYASGKNRDRSRDFYAAVARRLRVVYPLTTEPWRCAASSSRTLAGPSSTCSPTRAEHPVTDRLRGTLRRGPTSGDKPRVRQR